MKFSPVLKISNLKCGYNNKEIVAIDDLELSSGDAITITGANGAGKSTLLRTLCGMLTPISGKILIKKKNIFDMSPKQRAQTITMLLQIQSVDYGLTVTELVRLGRTPYLGKFGYFSNKDLKAVERAIDLCDLRSFKNHLLDEISGGEKQLARLAMILAQQTSIILLDEPSNHLDFSHRYMLYKILENIKTELGVAVIMVTHNLEDAKRFASKTLLLKNRQSLLFKREQFENLKNEMVKHTGLAKEWIY